VTLSIPWQEREGWIDHLSDAVERAMAIPDALFWVHAEDDPCNPGALYCTVTAENETLDEIFEIEAVLAVETPDQLVECLARRVGAVCKCLHCGAWKHPVGTECFLSLVADALNSVPNQGT
jgi:hypothetical protein